MADSFETEELLTEYVQWAAQKKISATDTSPAAFIVERAQDGAYKRVIEAIAYIEKTTWTKDVDLKINTLLNILED